LADSQAFIIELLEKLLRRRGDDRSVELTSLLVEDLALESLEMAEVSVALEDTYGTDPYSEGAVPRTVGDIVEFYANR
jgi:acyl carrier protein